MKPTIPEIIPLLKAYVSKPENGVGGSLHIVLEDGNVNDSHVAFCRNLAQNAGDADGVVVADMLLQMSKTQRRKISVMFHELIP